MTIPNSRPPTSSDVSRNRPASTPTETPDEDRDDHRVEGELERGGAVDADDVRHGSAVGDRGAEIALSDALQVDPVLLIDRPVVPELVLDLRDHLRRRVPAERGGDRIARGDPHQDEHERQQDEDHRDDEREARERVPPE